MVREASRIRDKCRGSKIFFRALIEFSNICSKDCLYCGIRKSNRSLKRYMMSKKEIMEAVRLSREAGFRSLVLQSGQQQGKEFTDFVSEVVREIKNRFPEMGITLSVGEQEEDIYRKFYEAGAHRYLLRIETSSPGHYARLHPRDMSFEKRKKSLDYLRETGFQVGTGVIISSPFQRVSDLARDLLFIRKMDIDMVGMGPYIPFSGSPLKENSYSREEAFSKSINMISVLRLMMPDINIAAPTALQALDPEGREKALIAGANVIMPVATPEKYRPQYTLYDGKPCLKEGPAECFECIIKRVKKIGLEPVLNEWGDSPRFLKRELKKDVCNC